MSARIIMSFAMANHGYEFATWLRHQLMNRYQLGYPDSVYVDFHVARLVPVPAPIHNKPKVTLDIAPDMRPHMRSETKAFPIGARRSDWEALYKNAMQTASVMLIAYTPEYKASDWCMKEVRMVHLENGKRRQAGRPPLRTIVMEFTSAEGQIVGLGEPTMTRLRVSKTPGNGIGLAWDRNDYILSGGDMIALTNLIGQNV
ncbi:toll/interleukin-1 receptor domain-containing protein [Granulicella arctica]|uniref:toll/interleukin-1 receptor domain-containing protein n=1 Tax=Granulicella arctica TaxID=940613 RepID=UPI0021E0AD03|nr:toll/interleukin-1 receptor domain-containing protein [Granulicella arctica]